MPFKSARQLRACYGREYAAKKKGQSARWNCDKWLKETPRPECLPEKVGGKAKCRPLRVSESPGKRKIHTGPRGGKYFWVSGIKVYIPRD